jgi:hypothetical protein
MAEQPFSKGSAAPEPSPAARELLRAFREHESPSAAERELGLVALQTRLHAPTPAANGRIYMYAKAAVVTVAMAAAVLLVIKAVGSGVTAFTDRARQPAMEAPYHGEAGSEGGQAVARVPEVLPSRRNGTKAVDAGEATVIEGPSAEPVTPPVVSPPPRTRTGSSASGSTGAGADSGSASESAADVQAELELIKRATKAKEDGRHADGLAVLREHAERFPRGFFADERTVLRAELYCASGRTQQADALVESFLRERAGSALVGRMRSVCRE